MNECVLYRMLNVDDKNILCVCVRIFEFMLSDTANQFPNNQAKNGLTNLFYYDGQMDTMWNQNKQPETIAKIYPRPEVAQGLSDNLNEFIQLWMKEEREREKRESK